MEISTYIPAAILLLTGAIIGFGFDWFKEWLKNGKIKKSVMNLITQEVESNKFLLTDFWQLIAESESYWFSEFDQFKYSILATAINDVPFPIVSKIAWEKNFNLIPNFYNDTGLKKLWTIYANLDLLIQIKEHLLYNENKNDVIQNKIVEKAKSTSNILPEIIRANHFSKDVPSLAKKFKETIEDLIGKDVVKFVNKNII